MQNGEEVQDDSVWQFFQTISEFWVWSYERSVMFWKFLESFYLQTNICQNIFLLFLIGS